MAESNDVVLAGHERSGYGVEFITWERVQQEKLSRAKNPENVVTIKLTF